MGDNMSASAPVYHILNVTGFSIVSFDDAVKETIAGAWHNHHAEFEKFVSFEVTSMDGNIHTEGEGENAVLTTQYSVTLAISAIHSHNQDH